MKKEKETNMGKNQSSLKGIPGGAPKPKVVRLVGQPEYKQDPNEGKNVPTRKLNPATLQPIGAKPPESAYNPDGTKKR